MKTLPEGTYKLKGERIPCEMQIKKTLGYMRSIIRGGFEGIYGLRGTSTGISTPSSDHPYIQEQKRKVSSGLKVRAIQAVIQPAQTEISNFNAVKFSSDVQSGAPDKKRCYVETKKQDRYGATPKDRCSDVLSSKKPSAAQSMDPQQMLSDIKSQHKTHKVPVF